MKKAYLVLDNGLVFEGQRFGSERNALGELVFNTGMCGYIETLTDESYFGQIVTQTFPLVGNYGVIEEDFEGKPSLFGYVVKEYCEAPSNFRCGYTLDKFLKKNDIPGICGVDTREITRIIRESGVMNAVITDTLPVDEKEIRSFFIKNAVESVSCKEKYTVLPQNTPKFSVALIDFGAKKNITRELLKRDCKVTVFPYSSKAEEILEGGFRGVMLSNGPGDPSQNTEPIKEIQKLLGNIPMFGICLGHQLLALADGGKTVKLKYGHRGVNQPVKELSSGRVYITSQNHGYAVVSGSTKNGTETFVNANDNTSEGMEYKGKKAFSVQFHPEASAGPLDTSFLFDKFILAMEEK